MVVIKYNNQYVYSSADQKNLLNYLARSLFSLPADRSHAPCTSGEEWVMTRLNGRGNVCFRPRERTSVLEQKTEDAKRQAGEVAGCHWTVGIRLQQLRLLNRTMKEMLHWHLSELQRIERNISPEKFLLWRRRHWKLLRSINYSLWRRPGLQY